MDYDITALGEVLIDLTQTGMAESGVPQYAANPGGAPANVAVAAARLGARSAFVGRVGRDSFGRYLHDVLAGEGVETTGLSEDDKVPTTLAVVSVDAAGERSFAFYRQPGADLRLQPTDVPSALLENSMFLHFGSVSLTADPVRSTTLQAVQTAKRAGAIISYDPNYRPALWPTEETAVHWMREPLEMVDVLKISDEELTLVTGENTPEAGARAMQAKGIRLVLITLGAQGVFYRLGQAQGQVPGVPVVVADTNGAGDTFFGAVLRCLAGRGGLDGLTQAELEPILRFANQAAALTTSRPGAIPAMPRLAEVEAMLTQQEGGECHD